MTYIDRAVFYSRILWMACAFSIAAWTLTVEMQIAAARAAKTIGADDIIEAAIKESMK